MKKIIIIDTKGCTDEDLKDLDYYFDCIKEKAKIEIFNNNAS